MRRTLSLKRESLHELTASDLASVVGGKLTETCYSCLAYISCNILQCVAKDTILCVE